MFHLYSDIKETITIFVFLFADPRWEKLSLRSTDFRLKKNFRSFRCRKRDSWTKMRSADWRGRRTRSWGSSGSFSGDYFNLYWCSAIFFTLSVRSVNNKISLWWLALFYVCSWSERFRFSALLFRCSLNWYQYIGCNFGFVWIYDSFRKCV